MGLKGPRIDFKGYSTVGGIILWVNGENVPQGQPEGLKWKCRFLNVEGDE